MIKQKIIFFIRKEAIFVLFGLLFVAALVQTINFELHIVTQRSKTGYIVYGESIYEKVTTYRFFILTAFVCLTIFIRVKNMAALISYITYLIILGIYVFWYFKTRSFYFNTSLDEKNVVVPEIFIAATFLDYLILIVPAFLLLWKIIARDSPHLDKE